MLESAIRALEFLGGNSRDELERDQLRLFALMHVLTIVGEAAARVSGETRAKTPQIPWQQIVGMRNRLVHAYLDVDIDIVWDTTRVKLPPLIEQLRSILHSS